MVGRCTMLSSGATGSLISWVTRVEGLEVPEMVLSREMGYAEGSTIPSLTRDGMPLRWAGSAAAALGLSGETNGKKAAKILMHGRGPNGEKLRRKGGKHATFGWVLSAPKTVSLLLASESQSVRRAAVESIEDASTIALKTLEQLLTVRRGAQGKRSEGINGLVGVKALHMTSSAGDPHLHVHYVLGTSAPAKSDGKWIALDSRVLFSAIRIANAIFHRKFKEKIEERIGIREWKLEWAGSVMTFEISDLASEVSKFSKATASMKRVADRLGVVLGCETRKQHDLVWFIHRADKKTLAEAMEHALDAAIKRGENAARTIREKWRRESEITKKTLEEIEKRVETRNAQRNKKEITEPTGRNIIRNIAQAILPQMPQKSQKEKPEKTKPAGSGINPVDKRENMKDTVLRIELEEKPKNEKEEKIYRYLLELPEVLSERGSGPFTFSDLVAHFVGAGFDVDDARELSVGALRLWRRNGLVELSKSDIETLCSVGLAGGSSETRLHHVLWSHTTKIISKEMLHKELHIHNMGVRLAGVQRRKLKPDTDGLYSDQARAAEIIARGRALCAVQGVAGAGKTLLLQRISEAAKAEGIKVKILTRNAKLAADLGLELEAESGTVAKWKKQKGRTDTDTMIIVDEAGLLDQEDWIELLHFCAKEERVQIVAVGDRLQSQPIDRKATWAIISQATQKADSYAELVETIRNREWREEAYALRAGKSEAITMAKKDNRIVPTLPGKATEAAAKTIMEEKEKGRDVIAVAATNQEAAEIAEAVQKQLRIEVDQRTELRWGQMTGIGDIVRTRRNDQNGKTKNGEMWQVTAIDDDGIEIRSLQSAKSKKQEKTTKVSHTWAREHLELGYATTVDSAQGITVDRAIVVIGPYMGRTKLYAAATRGREAPIYITEIEPTQENDRTMIDIAENKVKETLKRNDLIPTLTELIEPQRTEKQIKEQKQEKREIQQERQGRTR